ncbi:MAG: NFACT family protein [Acidobacteria bacterium]|nr:NFACT family protein [Acidobacteriota bacterium]
MKDILRTILAPSFTVGLPPFSLLSAISFSGNCIVQIENPFRLLQTARMENFTLHALTVELATILVGHRIGKIYQIGTTDLALDLRLRDGRLLIVSTDPKRLALYLTTRNVRQLAAETRTDTPFVALAKKYLGGARVEAVEGLGYDRVVRVSLFREAIPEESSERDETPETNQYFDLVIQLTGRSANVLILENNRVLASLRERQTEEEVYHEPAPPPDKIDYCPPEKLMALIEASEGDLIAAAQNNLIGFGLQYATEFAARAQQQTPEKALPELLEEIFSQPPQPAVYSAAPLDAMKRQIGGEEFTVQFAPIEMRHLQHLHCTQFPTINQAADACFTLLDERRNFLATRQQIESQLNTKLKKLQSLLKNLTRERDGFSKGETHQRYGELLLANLHQAEKIGGEFQVVDFYDPEQKTIGIPAANQGTAQEAAEHYFKLARKSRTGLQTINARLPVIESQIAELISQMEDVRNITQSSRLTELSLQTGIVRPQAKAEKSALPHKKAKEQKISGVRRYRSSDGYEIMVGRTSRDNDNLTLRIAKSFDYWFHAADYPGSHVVLRNPKRSPVPNRAILEAAQLAAKFSQANNDSGAKIAVNYCEKKFVTKPKGFGVGQVRLSSFKTILVEPAEAGERIL